MTAFPQAEEWPCRQKREVYVLGIVFLLAHFFCKKGYEVKKNMYICSHKYQNKKENLYENKTLHDTRAADALHSRHG